MTEIVLCRGTLPIEGADQLISDYLDPAQGHAWPAYDQLVTNGSAGLVDGDLLAPALLDAPVDASRFRMLKQMMSSLGGIADLPPVPLQEATDDVVDAVAALYRGLDAPIYRRAGVRGTIVSKVLHRKRPDLVPLYDSRIYAAYIASGEVPRHADSVEAFMRLLFRAMRADLQENSDGFAILAGSSQTDLSWLRLLDILVWMSAREG